MPHHDLRLLFYGIAAVLLRARCIMLERERTSDWAGQYAGGAA